MPSAPNLNPPVSSAAVHATIFQEKAPQRGENLNPERGSEQVKCLSARAAAEFLGALNRGLELELTREPESGPAGWSRTGAPWKRSPRRGVSCTHRNGGA